MSKYTTSSSLILTFRAFSLKLIGNYGLQNKREVWRLQLVLAKVRKASRILLTLNESDPRRNFEGEYFLKKEYPPCFRTRGGFSLLAFNIKYDYNLTFSR